MSDFTDKKVVVIGAGLSGQAAVRLLVAKNARVKITDCADEGLIPADFKDWARGNDVQAEFGGHSRQFLADSDLAVLSPGVELNSESVRWAREAHIPVIAEIELAFRFCPCPVIAVTGSNGKTTVSTLITNVLNKTGRKAVLCGNVGTPFSDHVLSLGKSDFAVLEVSSFQCETIERFKPFIAVFLNFSQNHLDRHRDIDEYFNLKKRIFSNQDKEDYSVLNAQDERIIALATECKARVVAFNSLEQIEACGSENPNYLAVSAVASSIGISQDTVREAFDAFKGVEHRLEYVSVIDGVDYINDSKSTTAESARWAFENTDKPIHWICGGRDKNIDFSVLSALVGKKAKAVYAIGETQAKIKSSFSDVVEVIECSDLKEAVMCSHKHAKPGECVLLSPMCSSFDMFSNFRERGEVFKGIVNGLSKRAALK